MRNQVLIAIGCSLALKMVSATESDIHFANSHSSGSGSSGWGYFFFANTLLVCIFGYLKRKSIQAIFLPKVQLQEENDSLKEENARLKEKLNEKQPSSAPAIKKEEKPVQITPSSEHLEAEKRAKELAEENATLSKKLKQQVEQTKEQAEQIATLEKKNVDLSSKLSTEVSNLKKVHDEEKHSLVQNLTQVETEKNLLQKQLDEQKNAVTEQNHQETSTDDLIPPSVVTPVPETQSTATNTDSIENSEKSNNDTTGVEATTTTDDLLQHENQNTTTDDLVHHENQVTSTDDLLQHENQVTSTEDLLSVTDQGTETDDLLAKLNSLEESSTEHSEEQSKPDESAENSKKSLFEQLNLPSFEEEDGGQTQPLVDEREYNHQLSLSQLSMEIPDHASDVFDDLKVDSLSSASLASLLDNNNDNDNNNNNNGSLNDFAIKLKKGTKGKSSRMKIAGLDQWSTSKGNINDDMNVNDLMAMLDKKATSDENSTEKSAETSHSLMNLFKQPTAQELEAVQRTQNNWKPGEPVVQEFSMKEDMNKRGMRRSKKGSHFGTGSGMQMEDQNVIVFPFNNSTNFGLFCVFDGHAGRNCAVSAVENFPSLLAETLEYPIVDLHDIFIKAYEKLDNVLLPFEYEGCTGTTVFVWTVGEHRYLQCANVGDSTAFLKRGDSVLQLSVDHKPTNPIERLRIIDSGIEMNPHQTRVGGLAVSRALGDHFLKQEKLGVIGVPYVSERIQLESTDTILILASDGLWDVMNGERAMELCAGLPSADAMAKHLISTALEDPKCNDNITVIVVLL